MVTALKIILILASLVLIASILLQQGNSAGLSGAIGGGAEQLFGKKKGRGLEKFLKRITLVFAIVFIVASVAIVAWEPAVDRLTAKPSSKTSSEAAIATSEATAESETPTTPAEPSEEQTADEGSSE
jgi:preprotein translocase subunit SecG